MSDGKSFFEHQQLARRNTRVMVLLFLLAVAAVVVAVVAVLAGLYAGAQPEFAHGRYVPMSARLAQVPAGLYVLGALGTAGVILVVSLVNVAKLASGGPAVARMIGARPVAAETRDPLERRLVNVVEEMAIASGVRVPGVYIMDEERGINAFAAGWDVSGAVVAVTRGTLERLTRDELQGVVAHEFSHILNGDMRLNIRMLGVLAGIVFIGSIGEFIMRSVRGSRDKGAYFWLAGLALFVVGYVGLFFARLIKAAVSREREFLADASSVQFTRNPDGIAGALDQIRLASGGALISSRYAEDMSHMFFGQSIRVRLAGLFDTHPPLEERIRRVHPQFQTSSYRKARPAPELPPAEGFGRGAGVPAAAAGFASVPRQQGRRVIDAGAEWGRSPAESAKLVGTLDAGKIDYAARLLAALPAPLREEVRTPEGAAAAIVALLLAPVDDVRVQQLEAVRAAGAAALAAHAAASHAHTRRLGPAFHLPVVDLALPAVKAAPDEAKQALLKALEAVVHADRRMSLHEFVVLTLVRAQLSARPKGPAPSGRRLAELAPEAALILHLVAHAGRRADATGARQDALAQALEAGAREMKLDGRPLEGALTLPAAREALEKLKALLPLHKAVLVKGLFAAATADGAIRVAEAEILRLVGAVLDCPLPPLLQEMDPATLAA